MLASRCLDAEFFDCVMISPCNGGKACLDIRGQKGGIPGA